VNREVQLYARLKSGEYVALDGHSAITDTLGAFLAGEGTISVNEAISWARALGYEPQSDPRSGDDGLGGDEELKAVIASVYEGGRLYPVRVVLSNGEGDELDLGVFSQGVKVDGEEVVCLADGHTVAVNHQPYWKDGSSWSADGGRRFYSNLFIRGAGGGR
jgi:hypothetical protein